MELGIKDKIAIVTGGARGLGKADAIVLAKEGCQVAIIDILEDSLAQTADELKGRNLNIRTYHLDITDRDAVKECVSQVEHDLGPVDILVNNAAILTTTAQVPNLADELWDRDLAVNLSGAYNMTKAIYPGMRERKWGRIIFMSSIAGLMGGFGQSSYSATKMGVIGLAKSVALEGARSNVTANIIAPGIIGTEAFNLIPEAMKERMRAKVAFRKEGTPDDIAHTVAFLASEKARYITGAVIPITGGMDLFTF